MTVLETAFVLAAIGLAFVLSASAGLGGSLVLVPALAFSMGAKQGTAGQSIYDYHEVLLLVSSH